MSHCYSVLLFVYSDIMKLSPQVTWMIFSVCNQPFQVSSISVSCLGGEFCPVLTFSLPGTPALGTVGERKKYGGRSPALVWTNDSVTPVSFGSCCHWSHALPFVFRLSSSRSDLFFILQIVIWKNTIVKKKKPVENIQLEKLEQVSDLDDVLRWLLILPPNKIFLIRRKIKWFNFIKIYYLI